MNAPGFLSIALAEPHRGQLMRALEALSDHLQEGHRWDGHTVRLEALESEARSRCSDREDEETGALALMELLREECFGGAGLVYERVENSFIDRVLQSGHGLPITLSALALHLAEACGVALQGIGFPGHFVVGVGLEGPAPMIFDPFGGGQTLAFGALADLYTRATGRRITATAPMLRDALRPTPVRSILVRVCNNLSHHYLQRGSHDRAAEVARLLAALQPRGAALHKLASQLERRVRDLN